MSERPKDGVDPDATVMMSRDIPDPATDPDATVMVPAQRQDDDATVMMPVRQPDDDATVMISPAASGPEADADATVMIDQDAALRVAAGPDPEATIVIPTPGRRRDADPVELPPSPSAEREASAADLGSLGGLNTLVAAANPVLAVVPQIRHALRHRDPAGLLESLRKSIDAFERDARAAGHGEEAVSASSRALCALLDESAASTPWGASWARQGLLAERHAGTSGAQYSFDLLEKKSADPAANLALLEFLYACLVLGFEGRYRDAANGAADLVALRGRLFDQIRAQHPPYDGELSGHWRGVTRPATRPRGGLALWAAGSGAALGLAALYVAFSFSLGSLSDPVARNLAQLRAPGFAPVNASAPGGPATVRVSEQLTTEIARGEVVVTDAAGQSTIVIRSDRLFASGSARLESGVEAVILRVAEALDRVPGTILVTGHTDDIPIRTARFPSNWELSAARAASVVKLIAGKLKEPARLRGEGLADSAPVVPNDSAANRARNRRVTIILRGGS